jgi:head-tail adaptor
MRGKLKYLALIQKRNNKIRNRFNDLNSFEDIIEVWCDKYDNKSNSLLEAGQMVVVNEVSFLMDKVDIEAGSHRIIEDGDIYEITGVMPAKHDMITVKTVKKGKWKDQ